MDDATNLPEWNSIVEESTPSQTPIGVGTKINQRARFLGRKFESVAIVTEHVPNQRSLLKIDKPFALTITNRFEAAGRGTKLTLVAEGRAWLASLGSESPSLLEAQRSSSRHSSLRSRNCSRPALPPKPGNQLRKLGDL